MKALTSIITVLGIAFALAACGSSPTAPPSAGQVGRVIQTEGGSYIDITPTELNAMLKHKDFYFVNTHIPYEGEIAPTDAFVPYDALDENLGLLPADKNAKIVLYCRSDRMSNIAARELVKKGYTNLYNLDGGMLAWEQAGFPLVFK